MRVRGNSGGGGSLEPSEIFYIGASGSYPYNFTIPNDAKYIILTDNQSNLNKNITNTTNYATLPPAVLNITDGHGGIGASAYVKKVTSPGTATVQNPGGGSPGAAYIRYITDDYIVLKG